MPTPEELDMLRTRLEDVAYSYCRSHGGSWNWDSSKMRLTLYKKGGEPLFTLHVEPKQ